MKIQNVYCVGRNYRLHAEELGNELPTVPLVFTKPSHAVASMIDSEITIPHLQGEVHYELELIVKIAEQYKSGVHIDQAIAEFTLGIDLTLRDVQSELKAKGLPWLPAKGFKGSAVVGDWQPFVGTNEIVNGSFELIRNGEQVQLGYPKDMIFTLDELIHYIDEHYGLGGGDIIYTGTPAGVARLLSGDELIARWNGKELGRCKVK